MRIKIALAFLFLAAIFTVADPSAFAADKTFGTYRLNIPKSSYTPPPNPVQDLTVTREESDGGVKQTTTGQMTGSVAFYATYTSKGNGKDVPVTGNAPFDTIAVKRVNGNTVTDERKKSGGLYKASGITVFSNNGKLMTVTIKGLNGAGKQFTQVLVFDKQ